MEEKRKYDVLIIGGGVVGSAIAREFSRYDLSIALLEKNPDVCMETSGRNTGMIHGGFLYAEGSLKAECCVEGNKEFDKVAEELNIPFKRTGKLIVGFSDAHKEQLKKIMQRGINNGVENLELIDRAQMDEIEPNAGGNFAMYCPSSGIVDPFQMTIALAENAVQNGAKYFLNTEVIGYQRLGEYEHILHTDKGDFKGRWIVNAAGLNSASVSTMLGIPGYVIRPVKGEYIVLDKNAGKYAKIPVYPAPNPDNTFDVHATPTVDGNVLIGPDSKTASDLADYESTSEGIIDLVKTGSKMFTELRREYFIRSFAGIRPKRIDPETGIVQDFLVERREDVPGIINLVGIESPGLTSALPLARRAVALLLEKENVKQKDDFNPRRPQIKRFNELTTEERREIVAENANYGDIICRCENVSRYEILQAIHNPLGVVTVNGIKDRTRASMGRCQGGYCEMRIVEMIMQETGESEQEVELGPKGAWMFTGKVRKEDR